MIKREDIHAILELNESKHYGTNWRGDRDVDYRYVKDSDYAAVEQDLLDLLFEINAENAAYAAKCLEAIAVIAKQEGLDNGFRVISNCGADAGQTVFHLHFHILAGKPLGEKLV